MADMTVSRGKSSPKSTPGSFHANENGDPEATLGSRAALSYVAPDHPALHKRFQNGSNLTTWGKYLEDIQPVGVKRVLEDGAKTKAWGAVYPGGVLWTKIPASVAKASGLPNITTPLETARDDLQLAHDAYDRAAYTDEYDPHRAEKASAAAAQARRLEDTLNDAQKDVHRDEVMNMTYQEAWALIDGDPDIDPYRYNRHHAELLSEHPHPYVVRAVAARELWRLRMGEKARERLITHSDETVRANFVSDDTGMTPTRLAQVIDTDSSPDVAAAALKNMTDRGLIAPRKVKS